MSFDGLHIYCYVELKELLGFPSVSTIWKFVLQLQFETTIIQLSISQMPTNNKSFCVWENKDLEQV